MRTNIEKLDPSITADTRAKRRPFGIRYAEDSRPYVVPISKTSDSSSSTGQDEAGALAGKAPDQDQD
jgi:hypothetical protein